METTTQHLKGTNTLTTINKFTYDPIGRIKKQTQQINTNPEELIVENTYDELGKLLKKGIGHVANDTINRLQVIDYAYTVRGWLKQVNDVNTLGTKLFSFAIQYDGNNPLYNGNISKIQWKTANTDNSLKIYDFTYDDLNRITSAIDNTSRYNLTSVIYDKNGNITSLERKGHLVENPDTNITSNWGTMDVLKYYYQSNSNKLTKVNDTSGKIYGFKDGTNTGSDYAYDTNGNLTKDLNKGIGTSTTNGITYNHLNLPTEIKFDNSNNKKINYFYDAIGIKIRKIVNDNGVITTTDYAGNYVYENNALQFFSHPEGYVNTNNGIYRYVYQYKDHLGNIRLSYSDSDGNGTISQSEIIEESNYYPFGLKHKGYNANISSEVNSAAQKFKYNGKELEESLNLNNYDLGARQMDPALGRFMQIDPLADVNNYQSPYVLADNNPILFVDVFGLDSQQPPKSNIWRWIKNLFGRKGRKGKRKHTLKPRPGKVRKTRVRRLKNIKQKVTPTSTSNNQVAGSRLKQVSPINGIVLGINPFETNSAIKKLTINPKPPISIDEEELEEGKPIDIPSNLNFGSLNLRQFNFNGGSVTLGQVTRLGNDPATQRSLLQIANVLLQDSRVRLRITFQSPEDFTNGTGVNLTPTNITAIRTWNKLKFQRLAQYLFRQFGINRNRISFSEEGLGGRLIFFIR